MQYIELKDIFYGLHLIPPAWPSSDFGLLHVCRNGRTGFRLAGAPFVGAGRPGAPGRLSDRSLRPRLGAARRPLPAGEILSVAHTDGSSLRFVKKNKNPFLSCNKDQPSCQHVLYFLFKLNGIFPFIFRPSGPHAMMADCTTIHQFYISIAQIYAFNQNICPEQTEKEDYVC